MSSLWGARLGVTPKMGVERTEETLLPVLLVRTLSEKRILFQSTMALREESPGPGDTASGYKQSDTSDMIYHATIEDSNHATRDPEEPSRKAF